MTPIGILVSALACFFCGSRQGPFWAVRVGEEIEAVCGRCVE